ncbi:MAG: metal-dependent hydrolase [Thermoplasmata archaeon]|jgi:hypothetical protein
MANLLAHGLFALALSSVFTSLSQGVPLTAYGFYAALTALLPDLELDRRSGPRTPYGHSLAYGLVWALLVLAAVSLAGFAGLLPLTSLSALAGACLTGLASHLFLDSLAEPGILTWPRRGQKWGRVAGMSRRWAPALNLTVLGFSVGTILTLLVLY